MTPGTNEHLRWLLQTGQNPSQFGYQTDETGQYTTQWYQPPGALTSEQMAARDNYSLLGASQFGLSLDDYLRAVEAGSRVEQGAPQAGDRELVEDPRMQQLAASRDGSMMGDILRAGALMAPAGVGIMAPGLFGAGAGAAGAAEGAVNFAAGQFPTITGATTAAADLGIGLGQGLNLGTLIPASTLPAVGGISSETLSSILGGAGSTINGPLGPISLDALGNLTTTGVNLGNSALTGAGLGSAAAGAGGGGGAATTAQQASALSRIMSGSGTADDWLQLAGKLGAAGLGAYGASQQGDAFERLANKYLDLGAPARARLEASYTDPNSFLQGPDVRAITDRSAEAAARSMSAQYGNPFDSPNAWAEIMDQTQKSQWGQLAGYRNQLAAQGGLGVAPAASFDANAASGTATPYRIAGGLLGDLANPQKSIMDQMNELARLSSGNLFSRMVSA